MSIIQIVPVHNYLPHQLCEDSEVELRDIKEMVCDLTPHVITKEAVKKTYVEVLEISSSGIIGRQSTQTLKDLLATIHEIVVRIDREAGMLEDMDALAKMSLDIRSLDTWDAQRGGGGRAKGRREEYSGDGNANTKILSPSPSSSPLPSPASSTISSLLQTSSLGNVSMRARAPGGNAHAHANADDDNVSDVSMGTFFTTGLDPDTGMSLKKPVQFEG